MRIPTFVALFFIGACTVNAQELSAPQGGKGPLADHIDDLPVMAPPSLGESSRSLDRVWAAQAPLLLRCDLGPTRDLRSEPALGRDPEASSTPSFPWEASIDASAPWSSREPAPPIEGPAPLGLQCYLSILPRIDHALGGSVVSGSVKYSDLFQNVGFGIGGELSLLDWVTPEVAAGGYVSIGWDKMLGAAGVGLGPVDIGDMDDQTIISVGAGGKVAGQISENFFWDAKAGGGLVYYSTLLFDDTMIGNFGEGGTEKTTNGLQLFKPAARGFFEVGGRVGVGNPQVGFEVGVNFRYMGPEAAGRDAPAVVDPHSFLDLQIEAGLRVKF